MKFVFLVQYVSIGSGNVYAPCFLSWSMWLIVTQFPGCCPDTLANVFYIALGWGLLSQFAFLRSSFSQFISVTQKHFIFWTWPSFDRCHRSWAAVTPVKCRCDWKNQTGTFAIWKILLTAELTNEALVTPTPGASKWTLNSLRPGDAYMRQLTIPSLVQIMAYRLSGAKPLSEPMLEYCKFDP